MARTITGIKTISKSIKAVKSSQNTRFQLPVFMIVMRWRIFSMKAMRVNLYGVIVHTLVNAVLK